MCRHMLVECISGAKVRTARRVAFPPRGVLHRLCYKSTCMSEGRQQSLPPAAARGLDLTASEVSSRKRRPSRRGAPRVAAGAAGDAAVARAYEEQARKRQAVVQEYAGRILRSCPKPSLGRGIDGVRTLTITDEMRATVDEVNAVTSCVMPEAGAFGTALNWRSARGCGLEPTESYHVVLTDGTIVAAVIRNYIPEELAVGWVELEEHHKEHADMWGLGCEAEPDTNIERTAAALKHAKGAAGYRIQKGMTVHSFGPRGGDVSNKLTITYTNCQGRTVCNFGIGGCPIERHQHSRRSLDYLYNPPSRASRLLECLEHGYAEHVKLFMKQKGFPTQVCIALLPPALLQALLLRWHSL